MQANALDRARSKMKIHEGDGAIHRDTCDRIEVRQCELSPPPNYRAHLSETREREIDRPVRIAAWCGDKRCKVLC